MKSFFLAAAFLLGFGYYLSKYDIVPSNFGHYEAITIAVPEGPVWLVYPDGRRRLLRDERISTHP